MPQHGWMPQGKDQHGIPCPARANLRIPARANRSKVAYMSMDQPRRNRRAGPQTQTQIRRRLRSQPLPQRRARCHDPVPDAGKAVIGQIAQPEGMEIIRVPTAFMRQIGSFAGNRASRACQIAAGTPA